MAQRTQIRLSGAMGVGNVERWSVGLTYGLGGLTLSAAQAQELAEDLADAIGAGTISVGTLANGVGAAVTMDTVEVYSYGAVGPAVSRGSDLITPTKTFTGTTSAPPQTTGCITLLTGLPGASRRGRIYWPQTAPVINTSYKSSTAQGLGNGLNTLNTGITNALAFYGPFRLCVYSAKLDEVTEVTAFRSGDVLDTQRRRRDALTESYTLTPRT